MELEAYLIVNVLLVGVGFSLILAEVLSGVGTLFDLLLSGSALITGGIIGLVFPNVYSGIVIGILLLGLYWFLGRSYMHSRLNKNVIPTNADKLVGSEAQVIKVVSADKLLVKVEGEEWSAIYETAAGKVNLGDKLKVTKADGAFLIVVKN